MISPLLLGFGVFYGSLTLSGLLMVCARASGAMAAFTMIGER
jgi:hypothetical protein